MAHYVVYALERLRDGTEEYSKVVSSIEEAEKYLEKVIGGFFGRNMEFRLFELGVEIPLKKVVTKEPQPEKEVTKLVVDRRVNKRGKK